MAVNRATATPVQPEFNRSYGWPQSYFFAQDSFRVSSRLTLNYGLRYERFGAPQNTGESKDLLVNLGQGSDFNARIAAATLQYGSNIFGVDNGDLAPRFGFSYDLTGKTPGKGHTVLQRRLRDFLGQAVRQSLAGYSQ